MKWAILSRKTTFLGSRKCLFRHAKMPVLKGENTGAENHFATLWRTILCVKGLRNNDEGRTANEL